MAFALVAHTNVTLTNSPATTPGINTTGATLICVEIRSIVTPATLMDSKGNIWTPLTNRTTGNLATRMFYCINPTVGAGHTFTGTNAGDQPGVFVAAFSATGTITFDKSNGSSGTKPGGGAATTFQAGSVTPANANSLIVAGVGGLSSGFGAPFSTIDSGFTITDVVTTVGGMAYLVETSIVAQNPGWATLNDAQVIGGENAVFAAAPAAINIPVPAAAMTFATFAPGVVPNLQPPTAHLVIATFAPTLNRFLPVPAGALVITGFAPKVTFSREIHVPAGHLVITTYPPKVILSSSSIPSEASAWWWSGPAARMLADAGFLLLVAPYFDRDPAAESVDDQQGHL